MCFPVLAISGQTGNHHRGLSSPKSPAIRHSSSGETSKISACLSISSTRAVSRFSLFFTPSCPAAKAVASTPICGLARMVKSGRCSAMLEEIIARHTTGISCCKLAGQRLAICPEAELLAGLKTWLLSFFAALTLRDTSSRAPAFPIIDYLARQSVSADQLNSHPSRLSLIT